MAAAGTMVAAPLGRKLKRDGDGLPMHKGSAGAFTEKRKIAKVV
jgi:hypothetical protein